MFIFDRRIIFWLLFPLNILCSENPGKIESDDHTFSKVTHHLKWITNQTLYPIKFSIPIKQSSFNDSSVWDWIRISDQTYVSKLSDILETYLVTETESRASMYILKYDNKTHDQLSSYEPRFVTDEPNFEQKERDIFTLAYLKKHYINAHKTEESIKVSCVADFLIPNADHEYSDAILRMMEKYASFKLSVKSANFPKKPNFFRKQQVNPSIARKPNKQPPNLGQNKPQQNQNQPIFNPITNDNRQINPSVNQNPPVFYQSNQHFPEFEQDQYFQQNILPPEHEPFDPFHSFPIYNHINQYIPNDFMDDYNFFDAMHQYDGFGEYHRSGIGYPQFSFEPPHSWRYPYSRFDYDDRFYRFKRESEKPSEPVEPSEEDFDYDPIKFSKVRLSLGPVIINKPFEKEEVVSCLLNLINYDDVNLVYNSRIIKKIKTSDEQQTLKEDKSQSNQEIRKDSFEKDSTEKEVNNAKELEDLKEKDAIIEPITKQTTKPNLLKSSTLSSHSVNKKPHTSMMFFTDRPTFNHKLAKFEHYYSTSSINRMPSMIIFFYFIIAISVN